VWRNYFVTAVRHLTRNRLYAAISIASLAVGFAVAILVGIFVRHEVSYDRFLPDHDRLYIAREILYPPAHGPPTRMNETRIDIAGYLTSDVPQVQAATRLQPHTYGVQRGGVIYREEDVAWGDPNMLRVLKLRLLEGDPDTALSAPGSLILTKARARKFFGDADPLGQTLLLRPLDDNGPVSGQLGKPMAYHVTGVLQDLPSETHLKAQIFTPTEPDAIDDPPATWGGEALTYVRLAPGASAEALNRQMQAMVARHIPQRPLLDKHMNIELAPIGELHLPRKHIDDPGDINPIGDRTILGAVIGVGALILLTAAINFVGLMTARASQRAVEIGVRKAVGARRRDLIVQFMGEALIQVAVAFVLALAAAELLAPALGRLFNRELSLDYLGDFRFLAGLAAAALGVGLAAGLYPSLVLSGFRPASALKGGIGSFAGSGAVRQALVVVQFAVLVLLMIVIVTVSRQTRLAVAHAWPAGSQQVLLVNGRPICGNAFEDRVRTLPGVVGAACAMGGILRNQGFTSMAKTVDGQAVPVALGSVEAGFFELYGLHPLAGRTFRADRPADQPLVRNPEDDDHGPPVVLNAAAARRLGFATPQAAVDRIIRWDRFHAPFTQGVGWTTKMLHDQSSQVLGVVPDYPGLSREAVKPVIYWVDPGLMELLSIRVSTPAAPSVLHALGPLWRSSGHFSPAPARPLDDAVREAYADVLTLGEVVAVCAGLAVALACTGLFALASYTTEQRTKEFGVRKAMGATAADIARLLLWQFSKPVLAAILIAVPLGCLLMRAWLRGFGDRVALTPLSFIAIAAVAVLIAWATVLAHTWRVARTRPVAALRYE